MSKAKILYHDIGDYLSQSEKLNIVKQFGSMANMEWTELKPNEHGDWIAMRNESFDTFIPMAPEKNLKLNTESFFSFHCPGLLSSREAWVYNFSKNQLGFNVNRMIDFYNDQRIEFNENHRTIDVEDFIDTNSQKISWTVNLKAYLKKNKEITYSNNYRIAILRPFMKQKMYYDRDLIERPGLFKDLYPSSNQDNKIICVSGNGANKLNCIYITDKIIDYNAIDAGAKCFPLYFYEENNQAQAGLFDNGNESEYIRRDGVSDFILERAIKQYGKNVSKEDIFYYVYGFLHSPEYREMFANDLKKMLPRLPLVDDVKDFWAFSNAGRKLADLHLNYETVPPYEGLTVNGNDSEFYKVEKMRFPKKGQKDTIIYNNQISITNIPEEAYEYIVNGKSAIEWIMERYAVTTHKDSGIKNDPNDWAEEVGNPRYILDLVLSIVNVSVQTVGIVKGLPEVKFD